VLSQAADEAAKAARVHGAPQSAEPASKADAGAVPRVGSIAENWGGRGGSTAFADQGISGGDGGRQSDGRGSSGSGSQQQPQAGQFVQVIAGANTQATAAVRGAADANAGYETVSDQIAAEVRAELRADGMGDASSDGVAKVLHLELKPANLGSVTIRLALKDNVITMHIETQRSDTHVAIERDRQALTEAMTKAGYSVDGITVVHHSDLGRSVGSPSALGDSASSASQGGASGQASQDQAQTDSSGGQGHSSQAGAGNSPHRPPSDDKNTNVSGVRRDANGLYV
jgi:chemotaxis protein MotD